VEIVDNKALLFRTRNPYKYAVIPKHKVLEQTDEMKEHGIHEVLVYFGLDEVRVLRNLGVKQAPSPITVRYDWPGRYTPMAHQIETSSFFTLNRKAFCFNDPGTGKTLSVLWAADYLMRTKKVRRMLILCPLSIMHSAWMQDITNSVIHRTAVVAHHDKASRRIEMVQKDYEIVITNYDGLALIANEVRNNGKFDLVVVDEANAYKNPQTRRWKALASILTPDTYLWMLTGTPAAQSPVDAYGLAKLVNPDNVPRFFTAWRDKVMNKISMFKWSPKTDAQLTVYNALQPSIRFSKEQCLDLPPVITITREVPMTPQQNKYYKDLKTQLMVHAAGETISAVNAGVAVNKLLQISCGAAYTDDKEVIEFDCAPRLNVLEEVLEETNRKVLIFAMYRSSIDTITTYLTKKGINCAQIHGDVSATKRAEIIRDFQTVGSALSAEQLPPGTEQSVIDTLNGMRMGVGIRVLVMQPQATAHGITLTAADTVVFYGPLMSVEQYQQCIARADRKGQSSDKVTVVHIESSPIEKKLFRAMSHKVDDASMLRGLFEDEVKGAKK
jgi:SNF2 family DNA or RNA helicase